MRGMVVDACMEARTPGTLPHTLRTFGVHFVSNNLTRPTSGIACPALSAAALHHMLFAAASEQTAAGAYLPRPCMTLAIEALMPPCGGHACSPFRSCSRAVQALNTTWYRRADDPAPRTHRAPSCGCYWKTSSAQCHFNVLRLLPAAEAMLWIRLKQQAVFIAPHAPIYTQWYPTSV